MRRLGFANKYSTSPGSRVDGVIVRFTRINRHVNDVAIIFFNDHFFNDLLHN